MESVSETIHQEAREKDNGKVCSSTEDRNVCLLKKAR